MNSIVSMMIMAMFIEAIVQVFKPVWDKNAAQLTVPEWISMGVGIMIAVASRMNMLEGLTAANNAVLEYMFYIFTGVALGRGPSFVHDLWGKIKDEETIIQ